MHRLSRLLVLLLALPSSGAELGPRYVADGVNQRVAAGPAFAALRSAPVVVLEESRIVPYRVGQREIVGKTREFPSVAFPGVVASDQRPIAAAFRSAGAARVRLRLADVAIGGESLWVYGSGGTEPVAFGSELIGPDGTLWTPSVPGDTIYLEAPARTRFAATALAHIARAPESASTVCFTDVSCNPFSDREVLSKSIAQLLFLTDDGWAICTGGLINAKEPDTLLLTANHCLSTAAEAATLEASWDGRTTSCSGTVPAVTPRSQGATLLATSRSTDVTLLRMTSLPAGRWLMGWSTAAVPAGTTLYRISHPATEGGTIYPQRYSTTTLDANVGTCTGIGRPDYLYSRRSIGGIGGGSSGSPAIIAGGYIVGQLYGVCGQTSTDGCANDTFTVDGALSRSYAVLQPYLDPNPASCSACVPNATTACMLGNRFKVTITWSDATFGGGSAKPIRFAENTPQIHPDHGPIIESTYFAFYDFFPNSVETIVKMTKGIGINDKYWIFVTGFTGASYNVTVQDAQTCTTWQRSLAANATTVLRDYEAFPFP